MVLRNRNALAATAAKLSRPPAGFGNIASSGCHASHFVGRFFRTFSEVTQHSISLFFPTKTRWGGGVERQQVVGDDRADSLDLREKRGELLKRRDK